LKVKILSAMTAKGLEDKVNNFIVSKEVTLLKIHFSSSSNGVNVLIEYEENMGE